MDTAIVVFTRDLRLRDNPALHLACAQRVRLGYPGPLVGTGLNQDPSGGPAAPNRGA